MLGLTHNYLTCTIRMNTTMVQETTCYEKPKTTQKLNYLRMIYQRNVKQTVVWHGIWSLSVSRTATDTHRHHPSFDYI